MSGAGVHFTLFRGEGESQDGAARRDLQELWFALARQQWSSLVLVPADEGFSVSSLAKSLADIGGRLRDTPVTAIVAESMDYESARMLADLQLRVQDYRMVGADGVSAARRADAGQQEGGAGAGEQGSATATDGTTQARPGERIVASTRASEGGQIVVAIQPIVSEPLGVAVAHAADAVILCIQLGRTRLDRARRSIELIGADRIIGAVLVN